MTNKLILTSLFLMFAFCFNVVAQNTLEKNSRGSVQRTGVYDAEPIDHLPTIAWQDSFPASDVDALLVDDQIFLTATEERNQSILYSLSTSGERLWSVPLPGVIMGAMAYGQGLLLIGTSTGRLVAIDPQNGETRWTFSRSGRVWGSPLAVDERIYIASERGWFALETETGEEIWHQNGCRESASAVMSGDLILFPCRTTIEAVEAETGDGVWTLTLESPVYSLAVDDNLLIATGERSLFAIDLSTQAVLWNATTDLNWSAPAITDERIFAGNMDGFMYAYDRTSGDPLWSLNVEDWATTDPVVIEDGLYFGIGNHFDPASPRTFYALDAASGAVRWQLEVDGMVISEAAVGDDALYITTNNGTLYALSEE